MNSSCPGGSTFHGMGVPKGIPLDRKEPTLEPALWRCGRSWGQGAKAPSGISRSFRSHLFLRLPVTS